MDVNERQELIAAKTQEIQAMLEAWAIENGLLQDGDRILFSMQIERRPVVLQYESKQTWDMTPEEFFSLPRLMQAGAKHSIAIRTASGVRNTNRHWKELNPNLHCPTMREFLVQYSSANELLRHSAIGQACARVMIRMMQDNGLIGETAEWSPAWIK